MMMAIVSDKKIWVVAKCHNLTENGPKDEAVCVRILDGYGGDEIRTVLREAFNIGEDGVVLKLRNSRASLIPIGANIAPNSKSVPYILEVVKMYQNIKPKPRSIKISRYSETMRKKILTTIERIEKLEAIIPQLNQKRDQKIATEMEELDKMLKFLNKRLMEADNTNWKGMFKKHPLW